jgi:hypothetical protein
LGFGTVPKAVVQAFIAQIYVAAFGTYFEVVVQLKGAQKIKELTCAFVQEILARISRSLAQIFEEKAWHDF